MIFVPFAGALIFKKKFPKTVYVAATVAFLGLYLLCAESIKEGFNKGDGLTLLCAVLFSFHILAIDEFSPKVDGLKLSCLQFWIICFYNQKARYKSYFGLCGSPFIFGDNVLRCGIHPANCGAKIYRCGFGIYFDEP